jgi:TPR repeat protein
MTMNRSAAAGAALLLLLATAARAKTLRVLSDGSGDAATLDEALEKAQSGDEIELADVGRLGVDVEKKGEGLTVARVQPGGSGEAAGLLAGDRILETDGESLRDSLVWMKKAADQNFVPALLALGEAYEKGQGVSADAAQAQAWYEKALVAGVPEAKAALERLKAGGKASK